MKVKELIGYLNMISPDADLHFRFGKTDLYRKACARLIAKQPADVDYREDVTPMLENLIISDIEYELNTNEMCLTFEQGYICDANIKKEAIEIRDGNNKKM